MIDYELPMVDADKKDLLNKNFMFYDNQKNELINFAELMESVNPRQKKTLSTAKLAKFVVEI